MKITYDKEADAMRIIWNETATSRGRRVLTEDNAFLLMIDTQGNPMGIEILYVSDFVTNPRNIDYRDLTRPEPDQKPSVPK